jgi:LPXTG-motif cell wall-anchored protein
MKRFASVLLALGLGLLAAATVSATSAQAGGNDKHKPTYHEYVCPTWTLRGATGEYPNVTFGDAPAGSSVTSPVTVTLVKPTSGAQPGVEFKTVNAGIDLAVATDITVEYKLEDGATSDAGAVRLFYYSTNNADTLNTAPTKFDSATGTTGVLKLEGVTGHVGTLGLVYDASNNSAGKVKFANLKVDKTWVKFKNVCPTATPTATATATATVTATPTVGPTDDATNPPSAGGNPGGDSGGPSLPVTGTQTAMIAGGGTAVLALGLLLFFLARRRRDTTTFVAE